MVEPVSAGVGLGAVRLASKPINDIYEYLKSQSVIGFEKIKIDTASNKFKIFIDKLVMVKTIMNSTESVSLNDFYHAPKIKMNENALVCKSISEIDPVKNLVVRGTAGQGKSMFMRYMTSQEAARNARLPVFFELRKLKKSEDLRVAIKNLLQDIFGSITDQTFDAIAESGWLVVFLDGFDEVSSEINADLVRELESFSIKYPNMQMIVSSRPDSNIEAVSCFSVVNIVPCNSYDQKEIVKKIVKDCEAQTSILSALKASESGIKELLKTPLMIVLFVLTYSAKQKLPDNVAGFYKELFSVLMIRHDAMKPTFSREFSTGLNEQDLQQVFETFCFLSKKEKKLNFNYVDFCRLSGEALNKNDKKTIAPSKFLNDMTKVVCLVVVDGLEYSFIHKSIQEFFVASYVAKTPESASAKFYDVMKSRFYDFRMELAFLKVIDQYRYLKFLYLPLLEKFLSFFNFDYEYFFKVTFEEVFFKVVYERDLSQLKSVGGLKTPRCYVYFPSIKKDSDFSDAESFFIYSELLGIAIDQALTKIEIHKTNGLALLYYDNSEIDNFVDDEKLSVEEFSLKSVTDTDFFRFKTIPVFEGFLQQYDSAMNIIKIKEDESIFDDF